MAKHVMTEEEADTYNDEIRDRAADFRLQWHAPMMLDALKEIAKGEGAYSHDQFEHARNTIENMKSIALTAIAKVERE